MKLRSWLLLFGGIVIGFMVSRKIREDDPNIVSGPVATGSRNPALTTVSSGAARIVDRASVASLDAIRRTRAAIRLRLADDDVAWN